MFPINAVNFESLLSTENIIVFAVLSVANAVLLFFSSMKFILSLQQSGYHGKRYFKWLASPETPYLSRLMLLCLLGFMFFCVLNTSFMPIIGETFASYLGFISYGLFTGLYINTEKTVNAKIPIKKTKRLVRLLITYFLVLTAVTFGLFILLNFIAFNIGAEVTALLRYSLICGLPILMPYLLFLAYCLNEPVEEIIRQSYMKKARLTLEKSDALKIGITGSYGKTSVKYILKTLLSVKYRVLASPDSYNTPMGIALTVKGLDKTHDVFIAEMGARSKGDIAELCRIVKPKYGVLTGLNNQHLESFGSPEKISATKFELFESLPKDGIGFFSADCEGSKKLYEKFNGEKFLAGRENDNSEVFATDITTSASGMKFTLNIKNEKTVKCSTVLLGKHSVSNICLAAAVAHKIGLSSNEIAEGINRLQSVGHRLELVKNNKNIVIIDDSYNSNEDGVKSAMEVLDNFSGRKIVLTPGLVELGKIENVANLEFGKILAKHADFVIIIGKHNAEMLINGLTAENFDKEKIVFAKTLNKGNAILNEIMKEGDVVLFENDLPDNYS